MQRIVGAYLNTEGGVGWGRRNKTPHKSKKFVHWTGKSVKYKVFLLHGGCSACYNPRACVNDADGI